MSINLHNNSTKSTTYGSLNFHSWPTITWAHHFQIERSKMNTPTIFIISTCNNLVDFSIVHNRAHGINTRFRPHRNDLSLPITRLKLHRSELSLTNTRRRPHRTGLPLAITRHKPHGTSLSLRTDMMLRMLDNGYVMWSNGWCSHKTLAWRTEQLFLNLVDLVLKSSNPFLICQLCPCGLSYFVGESLFPVIRACTMNIVHALWSWGWCRRLECFVHFIEFVFLLPKFPIQDNRQKLYLVILDNKKTYCILITYNIHKP